MLVYSIILFFKNSNVFVGLLIFNNFYFLNFLATHIYYRTICVKGDEQQVEWGDLR
jgi:hypothetical protein